MSNKNKKYQTFREFYDDEERPRKKPKSNPPSQKSKDKLRKQFRFIDPKNIKEDDFDDIDYDAYK